MSDATPIETPAGYAPGYAVGYADPADNLILVSETDRLPVASFPPAPAPMAGQASAPGLTGPFEAVSGRVVAVTLGGIWQGIVKLLRSTNGGATLNALRVAGRPWAEYSEPGCPENVAKFSLGDRKLFLQAGGTVAVD